MKRFLFTLGFMTRIPIPLKMEMKDGDMEKGFISFPIVGLIIGLVDTAVYLIFSHLLPEAIAIVLAILANLCVTGAFHLDGLCDTVDGIYSARTRERMLEIMKDSRIGTNGGIALVLDLALKFMGIWYCDVKWLVILLMPVAGKLVQGVIAYKAVYPRKNGIGIYVGTIPGWGAAGAALIGLIPLVLAYSYYGVLIWAVLLIMAYLFRIYITGKIGGVTGDVMGAGSELSEVWLLFMILILTKYTGMTAGTLFGLF
ncbi:MAG: adenosylcobinamide-GDP ribazoletransferase [Lachnospiraceae bacterium]|nr:adenosylcobinamide-GDP ribazoletransferase [Lachnospiraceae bacterium]